jgi:methylphosphotriester-DNA--protein-cysteine methyltransferase
MSVSSFHRHFRAVTSMTPIEFQKQIRLREARARLGDDRSNDILVSDVLRTNELQTWFVAEHLVNTPTTVA